MSVLDSIKSRRSIRSYTDESVDGEELMKILEAGRWAPSGLNNQPWRFKILEGEKKDVVAEYTKYGGIIRGAPTCIVVFLDREESYDRVKDIQAVGACIQNMLLEIHELGLGGVWLGEIINQKDQVNQALGLTEDMELMGVIPVGHPAEDGESTRKELDELFL